MSERVTKTASKTATISESPEIAAVAPDFSRAAEVVLSGLGSISGQLLGLTQSSIQAGLEAAEEMRQCQSPEDLMEVQLRHTRRAYETYFDGLYEVSSLISRTSIEAIEALGVRPS